MNSFRCRSSSALRSTYTARVHLRICCCKSDAGRTHSPTGVHDRGLTTPAASRVPALAEATASPAAAATIAVNTNVPNQVANGPLQTSAKNSPLVWEQTDGGSQAYGALFLWLLLGNITALQQWGAADFIYFMGLAVLTVYIGAHKGLTSRSKQQLQLRESLLAPVLASCSLFGLYLLIKYLPNFSLQTFLDAYFWLLGTVAISNAARPVISKLSSPLKLQRFSVAVEIPPGLLDDEQQQQQEEGGSVQNLLISPADVAAVLLGAGLASYELLGHHTNFTLNNMVACLVATEILALVDIKSFKAAGLLLLGLMAYDVFWVFGSPKVVGDNVMLTVATSDLIVGPTRLLFPRGSGGTGEAADFPFSLLGLGDIAIPGLLACLALRFDLLRTFAPTAFEAGAERHGAAAVALTDDQQQHAEPAVISQADNSTRPGISSSSSLSGQPAADDVSWSSYEVTTLQSDPMQRPHNSALFTAAAQFVNRPLKDKKYFKNATVAHVVGLFTAFAANSITHLGQPALLYIVPAMSLAVVGTAASQSEVGRVWSFTDAGLGPQGNPAAGQGKAASTPRKE